MYSHIVAAINFQVKNGVERFNTSEGSEIRIVEKNLFSSFSICLAIFEKSEHMFFKFLW